MLLSFVKKLISSFKFTPAIKMDVPALMLEDVEISYGYIGHRHAAV
jgi:hypothetical protein